MNWWGSPTTKRSKLCTAVVAAIAIVLLIDLFLLPYIRFDTGDRHYFNGFFRSDNQTKVIMWQRRRNQQQQQQICAFEVYLKQLAKVSISQVEMNNMMANEKYWPKSIQPNPYKVFIYTTEQLNDKNETRQMQFQLDLQHFLHLKTPLMNFNHMPKSNVH